MAQVYAADQGLQLQNETVEAIMYDDAALLLLVIKGGVVFAYDVALDIPTQHEQLVWTYPLQEGPPVICARCSLDRQLLALQRSKLLVELVDLPSGNISVTQSDKGRSELLGLFFSEWPEAQVVLLSRAGLEMCTLAAKRQGLHTREKLRMPIHWYQYSHETRCCLVATGPPLGPPYLQAWQFVSTGLITLPPFALSSAALGTAPGISPSPPATPPQSAAAATRQGAAGVSTAATPSSTTPSRSGTPVPHLPVSTHASAGEDAASPGLTAAPTPTPTQKAPTPSTAAPQPPAPVAPTTQPAVKSWSGSLAAWMGGGGAASDVLPGVAMMQPTVAMPQSLWPNVTVGSGSETVVPSSAVRLLKMYGRVYCAHVNSTTQRLDLYRMFTDTVVLQHSYPLPSTKMQLSVVDNVLVAHQLSSCSAMLIDVCADANKPVAGLTPLGHLAPLRRPRQLDEERLQQQLQRQARAAAGAGAMLGAQGPLPPPTAWSVVDEEGQLLAHSDWQFCMPNLVVDMKSQVVYRMLLDLGAIVCGSGAGPSALAAFLQRRRAPRLHVVPLDSLSPSSPRAASGPPAAGQYSLKALSSSPVPASSHMGLSRLSLGSTWSQSSGRGREGVDVSGGSAGAGAGVGAKSLSPAEKLLGSHPHPHPVVLSGVVTPTAIPSKLLLLQLMQQLLQAETALPTVRATFDAIAKAYAEVAVAASAGRASAAAAVCVLSPSELAQHTLCPYTEQLPNQYLQAVVGELAAAVAAAGVGARSNQQVLGLELLVGPQHATRCPPVPAQPTTVTLSPDGLLSCPSPPPEAASELGDEVATAEDDPQALGPLARALHCGLQLLSPDVQATQLELLPGAAAVEAAAALRVQRVLQSMPGREGAGGAGKVARSGIVSGTSSGAQVQPQADSVSASWQAVAARPLGPDLTGGIPLGAGDLQQDVQERDTDPGVALVLGLLKAGRVVKAAKVAHELKITGVAPQTLAAACGRDVGLQAALCRCFKTVVT